MKRLLQSVLAAALGVQSQANREHDFSQGRAWPFIVAGVVFTLLFVGVLLVIVQAVVYWAM